MEIAPGIHRIRCTFGDNRVVFVHLLVGDEASMLVDTGCAHNPEQDILPYMRAVGFDPRRLRYLLMSHSDLDHQGGNQPMKQAAPQAILMGHNLDRPWLDSTEALIQGRYAQFEADHGIGYGEEGKAGIRATTLSLPLEMTLEGGEQFRLGPDWYVRLVHTPGHTWGHLAVSDPRSRALIAGEAALWNANLGADWQPALPPTYCYVDTYLATIDRLLTMDIETFAPSHWPVQRGPEVAEFLSESRNYCLHVEQSLLDLAHERPGGFTLREAIGLLGPSLGSWPEAANQDFSYAMLGHLNRLAQRGMLNAGRDANGYTKWSLTP
ncbi:MAG: MBL fold metallo-hydrolase [Anaerolineae bacterium]|nr:MBL fold metallo-hydrolase [Anaerolineae bacterium]